MEFVEEFGAKVNKPMAALLIWFFGDFRCGVSLFIVMRVI